jgi:hypothetical protein
MPAAKMTPTAAVATRRRLTHSLARADDMVRLQVFARFPGNAATWPHAQTLPVRERFVTKLQMK